MPTNEKSECCNAKILSCDCMPKDGACFRRCSKCDVDLPTPDKLAEAKKLLEIWNIEKSDTMGGYVYINPIHVAHTDALLAAQSLISYERGREDTLNSIIHECEPAMPSLNSYSQEFRKGSLANNNLWLKHIRHLKSTNSSPDEK